MSVRNQVSRGQRSSKPTAVQRCDRFVVRTINWLYEHLRHLPYHRPLVLSDTVLNRAEFPGVEAWELGSGSIVRRAWRRLGTGGPLPVDVWRVKRRAPVVLHSHFGHVAADDLTWQETLGVPWFVSFYGADLYEIARAEEGRRRYREVFERAHRVLALGPHMKSRLEELGCSANRIEVHPLGVDVASTPHGRRRRRPDQVFELLFAGTFREKKGVEYLMRAVAQVSSRGVPVRLHLVGDATSKAGDAATKRQILDLVGALAIGDRVVLHSWLRYRELIALALRCHLFVHPSVTAENGDAEGTPFVIQQMMATAMPVLSTRHTDIPYILGQQSGLLVPERNAEALAAEIHRYYEDPDLMGEIGLAMRERVRAHFDVRQCARRLSALYDGR